MIIVFTSALIAYFISTIIGIAEVFRGKRETSKAMTIFAVIGFVMHTASLIVSISTSSHVPITTLQEAASFFSWSVVLLFLIVEYKYRLGLLGSFVMPIASVLMLSSSILPDEAIPLKPGAQTYWHGLHTTFAFMGGAVFAALDEQLPCPAAFPPVGSFRRGPRQELGAGLCHQSRSRPRISVAWLDIIPP